MVYFCQDLQITTSGHVCSFNYALTLYLLQKFKLQHNFFMDPEKRMNAFSAYSTFSQFYLCAKLQIATYTLFSNSSTFGLHEKSPHQAVKIVFKNYQQDKSSTRDATRTVQKSIGGSGVWGSGGLKLELFLNQNCPESHQLTRMVVTHTIHARRIKKEEKKKKKKSENLNV